MKRCSKIGRKRFLEGLGVLGIKIGSFHDDRLPVRFLVDRPRWGVLGGRPVLGRNERSNFIILDLVPCGTLAKRLWRDEKSTDDGFSDHPSERDVGDGRFVVEFVRAATITVNAGEPGFFDLGDGTVLVASGIAVVGMSGGAVGNCIGRLFGMKVVGLEFGSAFVKSEC